MLNISSLKFKNEQIKHEQKKVYKKIFENLCKTINMNAEIGKKFCLYRIPDFLLGEISFPFNECLDYINNKIKILKNEGITEISFYSPNIYYFKWKI